MNLFTKRYPDENIASNYLGPDFQGETWHCDDCTKHGGGEEGLAYLNSRLLCRDCVVGAGSWNLSQVVRLSIDRSYSWVRGWFGPTPRWTLSNED